MALEIDSINADSLTIGGENIPAPGMQEVVMTAQDGFPILATRTYLIAGHDFIAFGGANPDDDDAVWDLKIPQDWTSGGRIKIRFITAAAAGDDVKFEVSTNHSAVGDDMNAATQTGLSVVTTGSTASWDLVEATAITFDTTGWSGGDSLGFYIHRDASDAGDTYTGSAYISSITFEYNY